MSPRVSSPCHQSWSAQWTIASQGIHVTGEDLFFLPSCLHSSWISGHLNDVFRFRVAQKCPLSDEDLREKTRRCEFVQGLVMSTFLDELWANERIWEKGGWNGDLFSEREVRKQLEWGNRAKLVYFYLVCDVSCMWQDIYVQNKAKNLPLSM